jgi:MFS transporter, DHA2 family, multidrug resistance protein
MTAVDAPARAGRREWLALAVLCLPTLLVTVDISVLILALPRVSAELGAGGLQQLWITDIYGFMIAGFLVTMGTLGDRYGRRRVLLSGAAVFIVASVLAAFSTSTGMLIASRALLGVAAATIMPTVLALIRDLFRDPKQMGAAYGVWGTSIMAGVVLGPAIGGLLLGAFWWGSVFLMGVPVMGLLLVAGPALLPESRQPGGGRPDPVSVAISLGAILPAVYGLKEIARNGWRPLPVAAIVAGAVLGWLFIARQRRLASPLLDLRLFRIRALSAALVLGLVIGFVMSGTGLAVTMYLQMVEGLTPLRVALWMLPASLAMVVAGNVGPAIARTVRPAHVIAGGLALAAAGALVLTQVSGPAGLAVLVTALVIIYVGGAPVGILCNFLIMSSAPPEKAGSAGSLSSTGGELGVALGVAVLGSIGTAVYRAGVAVPAGVPAEAGSAARESIAGAVSAAGQVPSPLGAELIGSAQAAFTTSLHAVAGAVGVLFLGLAVLAVAMLRHVPPTGATPAAGDGADGQPEPAPTAARDGADGQPEPAPPAAATA